MVLTDGPIVFYLQESFARAKNWVKELQRQASPNIVIALSGNKADLANKRAVDFQVRANKLCLDSWSFFFAFLGNTHLLLLINMFVFLLMWLHPEPTFQVISSISLLCRGLQSRNYIQLPVFPCECVSRHWKLMLITLCQQDAQSYADDNSLLFMETSAKTSMNVNEIFMAIGG